MEDLSSRLAKAKQDNSELNNLISDYLPFIKKEISKSGCFGMEYDDCLSLAMIVFMNCVRQYTDGKGSFLGYFSVSLRHRLIDEGKKQAKGGPFISIYVDDEDDSSKTPDRDASLNEYEKSKEQTSLSEEIESLSLILKEYSISFSDLAKIGPKQKRSRELCASIAKELLKEQGMRDSLFLQKRLPQTALAKRLSVSEKTIEKHRKYIVAVSIILSGDYPQISAFILNDKEV